jgi:hypothetical protein
MFESLIDQEDSMSGMFLDPDCCINDGQPVMRWHGITDTLLLARCQQARAIGMPECAERMGLVGSLMAAGEPIAMHEWHDAEESLAAVEERLMGTFVGPIRLRKDGRMWNGHPALGFSQRG